MPPILVDRFWTVPNILCFFRMALAFVFLISGLREQWTLALWCFAVAAFTDLIDGSVARFLKQKSRFGGFIDPAADKLLMFFSFVVLTARDFIPWPLFAVVFARDLMITVGVLTFVTNGLSFQFQPTKMSKLNTAVQIAVVALALSMMGIEKLHWDLFYVKMLVQGLPYVVTLCYATTIITAGQYIAIGLKILRQGRHEKTQAHRQ